MESRDVGAKMDGAIKVDGLIKVGDTHHIINISQIIMDIFGHSLSVRQHRRKHYVSSNKN